MIIKIKKPATYDKQFLSVGVDEWQEAFKNLTPAGLGLYLLLASNKGGFPYELSRVQYEKATGKKKHAYYNAVDELKEKGYIWKDMKGQYNFSPKPKEKEKDIDPNEFYF